MKIEKKGKITEIFLEYELAEYLMSPTNGVNAVEWLYDYVILQRVQNACQIDPRNFDRVRFGFDEILDFELF
jgi:hypothetical protein